MGVGFFFSTVDTYFRTTSFKTIPQLKVVNDSRIVFAMVTVIRVYFSGYMIRTTNSNTPFFLGSTQSALGNPSFGLTRLEN